MADDCASLQGRHDNRHSATSHGARHSLRVGLLVLIGMTAFLNVAWTRRALAGPMVTNAVGLPDVNTEAFGEAVVSVSGQNVSNQNASSTVKETVEPTVSPLDDGLHRVEHGEREETDNLKRNVTIKILTTSLPPLQVHYTAKKPALKMEALWTKVNGPQIAIRFYSDNAAHKLVAKHRPHFLHTYDTQLSPVERADYFRYLVLWVFGGLYIDSDVVFVRPVDQWLGEFGWETLGEKTAQNPLESVSLTVGVEFPKPQTSYNATGWLPLQLTQFVIAGAKGSSVLAKILDHVEACVRSVDRQGDVERTLERTGPAAFTRAILNEIHARGVVDDSVQKMHREHASDVRHPRALLPCDELEKHGQLISLRGDTSRGRERVLVLPYRAFAFHSLHKITKEPVLTYHLFRGSWRNVTTGSLDNE